ncbi:MAG: DUF1003 domain-containing protein [Ardenticatenaceae bacterium]|nr:DUF1003 domain-containing protein [Ardenticatenaceae bacterium]
MMNTLQNQEAKLCPNCGQLRNANQMHPLETIPAGVIATFNHHESLDDDPEMICEICLNKAKGKYLAQKLEEEIGSLSNLERVVLDSIKSDTVLLLEESDQTLTAPKGLADKVVQLVGSWYFPLLILLFIAIWSAVNFIFRPFEPYPTIYLAVISAVLGSLAALYGPIILMSQRAQKNRDSLRARNDYLVNLRAELEVRYMGEQIQLMLDNQEKIGKRLREKGI